MTAAVLEAVDQPLAVGEVEVHDPRPGEVLVRVAHCGVCHSDLSVIDGSFPAPLPVVLGHEATGVVEEVVSDPPSPRYRIRWDDGHESIYAPAAGAVGPAEPAEKA